MRKIKLNKATLLYYYVKLVKEKGSPEYIAKGWALGIFVGMVVPIGFQMLIAIPLAFAIKGSKIGATVGTFITNHFTIIIVYPIQCWVGGYILGSPLSIVKIKNELGTLFKEPTFHSLFSLGGELIATFFVGGFFFAAIGTPITYFLVKWLVIEHRKKAQIRKLRKAQKLKDKKDLKKQELDQ
ncbi:MAG: DUF2062 domain-containing protein [Victivallaceae bacterium]|nr:DUF2062 domain-containing protein [Victivallaceae bacterium]MDD4181729.1 DUF2062 domain-containing protein [Victivallaceae bacterium]